VLMKSSNKIVLFSLTQLKPVSTVFKLKGKSATLLAFHPEDDAQIYCGLNDGSFCYVTNILNSDTKSLNTVKFHNSDITGLCFTTNPKWTKNITISISSDHKIIFYSHPFTKVLSEVPIDIRVPGRLISGKPTIRMHNNQEMFLVTQPCRLSIWKVNPITYSAELIQNWVIEEESKESLTCATFSNDCKKIYCASTSKKVLVLDTKLFAIEDVLELPDYYATSIAANPTNPLSFAIGCNNGSMEFYEYTPALRY